MSNRLTSFKPAIPTRRPVAVSSPKMEKPSGGANTARSSTKLSGVIPKRKFIKAAPRKILDANPDRSSSSGTRQDESATSSEEKSASVDNEASSFSESEKSTETIPENATTGQHGPEDAKQSSFTGGEAPTHTTWQPKVTTTRQKKLAALKNKTGLLKRDKIQSIPRPASLGLNLSDNLEPSSAEFGHPLVFSQTSNQHELPQRPKKTFVDLVPIRRSKKPSLEILRNSDFYQDALHGNPHRVGLLPLVLESYLSSLLNDVDARAMMETCNLKPDAAVALRWYGQGGFPYVQQSLRQKADPTLGADVAPPKTFKNLVKACQRGFAKLPALPPGTELYRGTNFLFDENLKPGDVYTDPAFVSTSTSPTVAGEGKFEGRYLLKIINVPRDERWRDISSFTANSAESEVLGLPGTTFRVVSREESARQVPMGDNGQMINQEIVTLEPIVIK